MFFFRAGIIAAMLIGLAAPVGQSWAQQAWAQYYPPRAYPAPQGSLNQPIPLDPDRASRDPAAPPDATGSTHIDSRNVDSRNMVALPPEVRPETGPRKELPPQFRRTLVDYYTKEPAGTIIVDTPNTYLYLVLGQGTALRDWRRPRGLHLVRRGENFQEGGMARLESTGADDRAPALPSALHGRWRWQPARRARALSR